MLKWKIGDVTITRVVELENNVDNSKGLFLKEATPEALKQMKWLFPHFVREDGVMLMSIHALLVEAPGLKLVVDTCVGNDKPRPELGLAEALQTDFLTQMGNAGFTRENVDYVVCTHLHVDHVGWNTMRENGKWVPTFPKARYLIGRKEYEHWRAESESDVGVMLGQKQVMEDSVTPIFDSGVAELVDMDHRISNEVRLMPTPGHTPGHVSVVIESKGERAVITGDLMHHPCQIGCPDWSPPFDSNVTDSRATRWSFVENHADKPVLVIGTHFATPTAGHIKRDGDTFRFEV